MENLPLGENEGKEQESEKMNELQTETPAPAEQGGESAVPEAGPLPITATEYEFPERLLSATELLRVSGRLLRPRLRKFFLVWIVGTLMGGAAVFLCGALAVVLRSLPGIAAAILIFLVLIVYLSLLLEIVGLRIAQDAEVGIGEAFRAARGKVRPLFKAMLASLALFFDLLLPLVVAGFLYALASVAGALAEGEAFASVINWLLGFVCLAWVLAILPLTLLLSVWQQFLAFNVVLADRPVMAGAARAWALVHPRKRALLWRAAVFFLPYLLVVGALEGPAEDSWLIAFVQQMLNFLFSFWMFMYFYSLYRNLEAMGAGAATDKDERTVRRLIRWGAGVAVLPVLALVLLVSYGAYSGLTQPEASGNWCDSGGRCSTGPTH